MKGKVKKMSISQIKQVDDSGMTEEQYLCINLNNCMTKLNEVIKALNSLETMAIVNAGGVF